jgi:TfoX/Sxy family transcriptional regulator of competence genes
MKRIPSPPALLRAFAKAGQSLRDAERRKMFGYPAMFVNGNMFAGLVRDRMILRLGEKDRSRFLELSGAKPFIAMGRRMREWVVVPPSMTTSPSELKAWLGKARERGRSLRAKAAKRTRDRR